MNFLKKIIVVVLSLEARLILAKYKPFIVAVTGSVGKTSAKDAIYAVLKTKNDHVRRSEKSLNSEIGLPLTVIGKPTAWRSFSGWVANLKEGLRLIFLDADYPDCLVLEVGADHPGDIKRVVKWLKPDIAVLTRVSRTPVHVEFFKSPEEVFEEKASLIRAVKKGGAAVIFADDEKAVSLIPELVSKGVRTVTYGVNESAQVRGIDFGFKYVRDSRGNSLTDSGQAVKLELVSTFKVKVRGDIAFGTPTEHSEDGFEMTIKNPLGRTAMFPILAAISVGLEDHMSLSDIRAGLDGYHAPKGRMNVISGLNGSTIIDDSYNSSPDAVTAALETLRELTCSGRKIAVLGDMMELGKYSAEEHRRSGREAAKVADIIITVGLRSKATADEAKRSGMAAEKVIAYDSSVAAADFLPREVKQNDIILVKGSQAVRMERVTKSVMAEPQMAPELLVRQEKEWLLKN